VFSTYLPAALRVEIALPASGSNRYFDEAPGGAATRDAAVRRSTCNPNPKGDLLMLWTIFVILLILWLLGLVTSYTMGGFIHILLVVAVIILIFRLVSGRRL
jgi:hypothetical protein